MPIHWRAPIVDYSQNYNEILEHDWFPPAQFEHELDPTQSYYH